MGLQASASARIDAAPEEVFAAVTDLARLPEWNDVIREVLEVPPRMEVGARWKVRIHAMGSSWVSRSEVRAYDRAGGVFAYRSQTDDGNPSFADWEWRIAPDGGASRVTVSADVNPQTFWRKHLLAKIRRRSLRKEMPASLEGLQSLVAAGRSSA